MGLPASGLRNCMSNVKRILSPHRADAHGRSAPFQAIIPAATVLFVASSITMKLPVARSVA
jgi:hypothetical protein